MNQIKKTVIYMILITCCQFVSASAGISETRRQLNALSQEAISRTFRQTVQLSDLGDWRDAIENSLYISLRKTDITRGTVSIHVADTSDFVLFMDCSGTFVISTGVLDFIDTTLFSVVSTNSRRIKNMTRERENLLIPLSLIAAARYTLDYQHINYMSALFSGTQSSVRAIPVCTEQQVFESDRFACILLTAIGYDQTRLQNVLEILEKETHRSNSAHLYDMRPYMADTPDPSKRIAELARMADGIETVASDIILAQANIRKGIGLKDSVETLRAVQKIYPSAICIDRFITTGMHKLWAASHPIKNGLQTLYAIGTYELSETELKEPAAPDSMYRETELFYRKLLEKEYDPYIASDFAVLLAQSTDKQKQSEAQNIAAGAAVGENFDGTISRRANYATVRCITGEKDTAVQLLKNVLFPTQNSANQIAEYEKKTDLHENKLYAGYIGRKDDAEYNYRVLTTKNGTADLTGADAASAAAKDGTDSYPIALRGVRITDVVDTLLMRWGKPDEILYDFYTELWIYRPLNTRITVHNGTVVRMEITDPSPISLPGELRTGDRRDDFELIHHTPVSRAYDYNIYQIGGQRIYIEYLSGKIRNILLCK